MKITKSQLAKIIREEVGGLTRPKGGSYGSNSEALGHLLKALESLGEARKPGSPLADDVSTDAFGLAKYVQNKLEDLISMVEEGLPPGNKEEPAWPVPAEVTPEDEEEEARQQQQNDDILRKARERYELEMQSKKNARRDMPRNKKDK
tara:strand:+ start:509 stop:952 length:444 start_codon:yes stop_codon:yes gene_type:complete